MDGPPRPPIKARRLRVELTVTGLRDQYAGEIEAGDLWFIPRGE